MLHAQATNSLQSTILSKYTFLYKATILDLFCFFFWWGEGGQGEICQGSVSEEKRVRGENKVSHPSVQGRVGGMLASWLVCLTLEQAVRVRALAGHCVVFLGNTLYSQSASLHPGV